MQQLAQLALVVKDYDEAIQFYTTKLNFELVEDTKISDVKRWVVVRPKGSSCSLLLAKAATPEQESRIGNQTGGRVFLFLHTDTFDTDLALLKQHQIPIVRGPVQEVYGRVVVFQDIYGNLWDLIGNP